jgi:hypothetical protein
VPGKEASMAKDFVFTSESVSEGHPDKMADLISDAFLDAVLEQDPYGKVACETLLTKNFAVVAGEIRTTAQIDPVPTTLRTGSTRAPAGSSLISASSRTISTWESERPTARSGPATRA